jgi:membrane-associated phospholipid phosphatase
MAHAVKPGVEPETSSILVGAPADRRRPEAHPHPLRDAAVVWVLGYAVLVGVMIAIGLVLTHPLNGTVGHWDESVNRWLAGRRTRFWDDVTGFATWWVNTVPAIGLAAVIVAACGVWHRWREAAMLVLGLVLELVVFLTVNALVGRPRPDVVRLNSTPSTSSFPSGHTAASIVIFAGLAIIVTCCTHRSWLRAIAVLFAIVVATIVGFGRVYRGLHYPTDVFAGALLGVGCLIVAILTVRAAAPVKAPLARRRAEGDWSGLRATAG